MEEDSHAIARYLRTEILGPLFALIPEGDAASANQAIRRVCHYVCLNVDTDITLAQCAESTGVSSSFIRRQFKQEVGVSFADYVTQCKVDRACNLLAQTSLSIGEIAAIVGYSDRTLYRIFQKYCQCSPGEYRSNFCRDRDAKADKSLSES